MCVCFQEKCHKVCIARALYMKCENSTRVVSSQIKAAVSTSVEKVDGWIYNFT